MISPFQQQQSYVDFTPTSQAMTPRDTVGNQYEKLLKDKGDLIEETEVLKKIISDQKKSMIEMKQSLDAQKLELVSKNQDLEEYE